MKENREHWGSGLGFILAAAGSAIGLGNIWKFPYITGENGGGAFLIIYLISIVAIGIPVLIAEIMIGRKAQKNPVGAFRLLSGNSFGWTGIGYAGVAAGFIILSYYNVVAGWSLGYVIEGLRGTITTFTDASLAGQYFDMKTAQFDWIIGWQAVFAVLTMAVVYFGVNKGIEKISRILMPIFFVILLLLVFWGLSLHGASKGIEFLFKPKFELVTGSTVLIALGHAFFTLSLGMGAMMTYGSYLSRQEDLVRDGVLIAVLDTLIAILAGVAIFTAVFSMDFAPDAGPGLAFKVLPAVFAMMPGGTIFAVLFFGLLSIAALTSAISLLEVITSYLVDELDLQRHQVVIGAGAVTFLFGIPSALSFGVMKDIHIFNLNFFDLVDFLSANILLPLGGMLIAVFVGYRMGMKNAIEELKTGAASYTDAIWELWFFFTKYVAPVGIALVLMNQLGLLSRH